MEKENINKEEKIMALPANVEFSEEKEHKVTASKQTESKELDKLFEALAKAQLEMEVAKANSLNPFFKSKYADLASVVKASRPFLAKNGISIIQRTVTKDNDEVFLHTRLCHSSGQWIESNMKIKPLKSDIQTLGSYLTYLRRYMYSAVAGVVSSEDDDDGEVAMKESRKIENAEKASPKISKSQLEILANELRGNEEILRSMLKGFDISKISDLPAKKYSQCIERIRDIKRAKEDENA
jgi:hypothetical protein